jgi:O-methyltransferase involved in polyketide biosynthesis
MADDDLIAPTAHYTAYVWKHLGLPYADLFATRRGALMFWGFRVAGEGLLTFVPRVPSMSQYLELRHLSIEKALEGIRPDAIIEIGAGFSRRGTTWAADRGVRYVEVDLRHQVEIKRRLIDRAGSELRSRLGDRLKLVSADVLADGFDQQLVEWIGDAKNPAIVAEGLISYFDMAERRKLFASIARGLSRSGGSFVTECRVAPSDRATKIALGVMKSANRLVTSGRGTRADFESMHALREMFVEAGFDELDEVPPPDRLARLRSPLHVWRASVSSRIT